MRGGSQDRSGPTGPPSRLAPRLALALSLALAATPAAGSGLGLFEQSARALGVAGAFTAQVDDPSAVYHNPGGMVFSDGRRFALGGSAVLLGSATFEGRDPLPGPGFRGTQGSRTLLPVHLYYIEPLGERWSFGFALTSPFNWRTDWDDPAEWAGRFLAQSFELRSFDLNPTIGWRPWPNLGVGLGVVVRSSEVSLDRRIAAFDPFSEAAVDVAQVGLDSDRDLGYGVSFGVLHRVSAAFSWGVSYRSAVRVDHDGRGRFVQVPTGNPELDEAMAGRFPFGEGVPMETTVRYPDVISVGVSLLALPRLVVSLDVKRVGWDRFDGVRATFPGHPDQEVEDEQRFRNVTLLRIGFRGRLTDTIDWRAGFLQDRSPQRARTVGPLLAQPDRQGISVGVGIDGGRLHTDVGVMYLPKRRRSTEQSLHLFNGAYESESWVTGVTVSW